MALAYSTSAILVVQMKMAFMIRYWTIINVIGLALSLLAYFLFLLIVVSVGFWYDGNYFIFFLRSLNLVFFFF